MSELVSEHHAVRRVDTEPPSSAYVENAVTFRPRRIRHYVGLRPKIQQALREFPKAPVLWASISPSRLGHLRDMFSVAGAFGSNQPVAGVVHRSGFAGLFESPLTYLSARRLVSRLDAFVFLNEFESDACAPWIPGSKRRVIPNTIDKQLAFSEDEIARKWETRRHSPVLRLLYLSNIIPLKGYRDLLEAAIVLHRCGADFTLDLVGRLGSEEDRGFIEHAVQQTTRDTDDPGRSRITWHGGIDDRGDIKEWYRKADAFILPTYHPTEAQPVSLIEAMNAGVPIITTGQGGIPTMLAEGDALFVRPKAPQDIVSAIRELTRTNRWMELAARSRKAFESSFSGDHVRARWDALIVSMASS